MKLAEITKKEFADALKDPRTRVVRDKVSEFEKVLKGIGIFVTLNENPYYEGVWMVTAHATMLNHSEVNTIFYEMFLPLEREFDIKIIEHDDNADSKSWRIHF